MKITFSFKLFVAFLVFGSILFFSSFFLSYTIFNKKFHTENINTFLNIADESQNDIDKLIRHHKFLLEEITKLKNFNNFKKEPLQNQLTTILLSNKELIGVSIFDNNAQEMIKLKKQKNKIFIEKKFFSSLLELDIVPDLLKLEDNTFYNSSIKLNKEDGEIVTPLEPIIYFITKSKNYTILLKVEVSYILESLEFANYIIDKEKNIIFDKNNKYSWSNYFHPELDLKELVDYHAEYLFTNKLSVTSDFYYKRINIDTNHFINIILSNEKISFEEFIEKYNQSVYAIAYISFIVAFVLALIFTTPLSNINKKLVTEKDQLNDSIQKNRLILSDSLELIDQNVMFLKVDRNWNIIDISHHFCEVSGFQKEELLGHNYKKLLHQSSIGKFAKVIKDIKEKKVWKGDLLNIKKTGIEYWVSSQIEVNYDQDGKIVSYTEIRTDVDDKKRIERLYNDLNYRIEQLNMVFDNVNSGIALISLDGEFKKYNFAFSEILNYQNNELKKKNFFELADYSSKYLLYEVFKELNELDSISNVEFVFLTKNNEEVYLDVSLRVLPDKENIVVVINSLEDKRKLQELNQTLEQRVKDEVQKNIDKDKLHQEQQIKNAKLTSIGTLAAGITHEINTPLTYLKGNFELLQMDLEDLPDTTSTKKDMLEGCEKIEEAITRISVIIESMREMSQTSSVAREKSNIYSTLVTSLTMAYNVSKQVSKIYLNGELFSITNIDKNKFQFFADVQKQRVEQVWIIIINNALDELKKTDDYEKRELKISVYEKDDRVIVKFQDNAGGIKEDILHKIFEPFISTKQHSGMGVGLNIAKKIIDEQDAEILAYNKDSGAVFEVRLKKSI